MAVFVKCPRCYKMVTKPCQITGERCGLSISYQNDLRHEEAVKNYVFRLLEEDQLRTMVNSQERSE